MAENQKLSTLEFEDLPDEDILKIFSFLDIKDILKCSQVSKRLWAISKDESLWLKLNLFQRSVPAEFIQKDLYSMIEIKKINLQID